MISLLQNKFDTVKTFDINKTVRSVSLYAWISTGVLFSGYLYFVGAITFSVIKKEGLEQNTKTLISSMSHAEIQYLSSQKVLTKEYAQQSGFVPPVLVSFTTQQKAFAWNVGL